MKKYVSKQCRTYLVISLISIPYAITFCMFFESNQITCAGLPGIAQIINHFLPSLPIGMLVFAMNLPMFLLSRKYFSISFLLSSLYSVAATSVLIDSENIRKTACNKYRRIDKIADPPVF